MLLEAELNLQPTNSASKRLTAPQPKGRGPGSGFQCQINNDVRPACPVRFQPSFRLLLMSLGLTKREQDTVAGILFVFPDICLYFYHCCSAFFLSFLVFSSFVSYFLMFPHMAVKCVWGWGIVRVWCVALQGKQVTTCTLRIYTTILPRWSEYPGGSGHPPPQARPQHHSRYERPSLRWPLCCIFLYFLALPRSSSYLLMFSSVFLFFFMFPRVSSCFPVVSSYHLFVSDLFRFC